MQLGEVENAAEMAARVAILAGRTNSARADARLRFLDGQFEPYRAYARVAEFFDAYREATVPEPRRPELKTMAQMRSTRSTTSCLQYWPERPPCAL